MRSSWPAHYYDGQSAGRHDVQLLILLNGLAIERGGNRILWPWFEVKQTQGFYPGEVVRLDRGPECVVIKDRGFLLEAGQFAPQLHQAMADQRAIRSVSILAVGVIVGLVAIAVLLWFGLPLLVSAAAEAVPVSLEKRLGQAAVAQLAPVSSRCTDSRIRTAIDAIEARLAAGLPDTPYEFEIFVVDQPAVNAFAAPGGYIVVFRGLIERASSAEELAAVLAHEVQHVVLRHSTRGLLREAGLMALLSVISGDVSGAIGIAGKLGSLQFQRDDEREADRRGLELMEAARIDPNSMVTIYEKLEREGDLPGGLEYLSTHPRMEERVENLRAASSRLSYRPKPIDAATSWKELKGVCR